MNISAQPWPCAALARTSTSASGSASAAAATSSAPGWSPSQSRRRQSAASASARRGPAGRGRDRALDQLGRPGHVADREAQTPRLQHPAMERSGVLGRRQPPRAVAEIGRRRGGAATAGVRRGRLQRGGDRLVGAVRREREVPRPLLGVADQLREPPVQRLPRQRVRLLVRGRGQQRMREAHAVALGDEHVGLDRRPQHLGLRAGTREQRRGRLRQRGDRRQRSARAVRQRDEAPADQLAQAVRDAQRLTGSRGGAAADERAAQLEREQRVAAGDVVDPAQHGPRQDDPEPRVQQSGAPPRG